MPTQQIQHGAPGNPDVVQLVPVPEHWQAHPPVEFVRVYGDRGTVGYFQLRIDTAKDDTVVYDYHDAPPIK